MQFHLVKESYRAADERESRAKAGASSCTVAVAVAAACGIPVNDFDRSVEVKADGPETVIAWQLAEGFADFEGKESVGVAELLRRARDQEWLASHADHPIAYAVAAVEAYKKLCRGIREKKPLVAYRKGKWVAYLVVGGNRQRGEAMLRRAGFSTAEMDRICREIYGA
jgi:hypothetical protein